MDDRHQYWGTKIANEWDGTYSLIPHIDLTLTAAPEAVSWYRKEGGAAIFFPEASDPEIFRPMPHLPKIHDISFVGGRYGIRERIVGALREAGIRVSAYGNGWEDGRISTEDIPALFAQSKIILGVGTIGHSDNFCALKLRDFDASMSGSCYMTTANPDLDGLFDISREIVTYRDATDCVLKTKFLLSNEVEREKIARSGRLRAFHHHTWDHRFRFLFDSLSLLS
jgi:spore maturation protein CgeB